MDLSTLFDPSVLSLKSVQPSSLSMVYRVGDAEPPGVVSLVPLNVTSYYTTVSATAVGL